MFTVELGQAWKRRGLSGAPHDAIALLFDGVNVLPRVAEESLARVVTELVEAVTAFVVNQDRTGQIALEESNLELCLWRRRGFELELQVIDFGQPPKRLGPIHHLELIEFKDAVIRCARNFMRDSGASVELDRQLRVIEATVLEELTARPEEGWRAEHGDERLKFIAQDERGRLSSWSKKSRASLPCLLIEGRLEAGAARVEGLVFLELMRLARAAVSDEPPKVGSVPIDPTVVFETGLEFVVALRRHCPVLAHNPYIESLQVRCIDGLAALKEPVPQSTPTPFEAAARPGSAQPLIRQGSARRVKLQARWSAQVALGEEGGLIRLSKGGVIVSSPHAVHAFTKTGKSHFRRLATRGVATSSTGTAVCADPNRLMHLSHKRSGASWVRDHDGVTLGPTLFETNGVGVTSLQGRGVFAVDLMTGRELWRVDPPRTQRGYLTVQGPRVLLTTDGGSVLGLDAIDGQTRFRIRASAAAVGPAIAVGHKAMFVLSQAEQSTVVLCEALGAEGTPAGTVAWSSEVLLSHPAPPVSAKQRTFIAGTHEEKTQVLCLDQQGQVLWQRLVACDGRTVRLVAFESGVIASDARGVTVRLLPNGEIDWVLGANGDELGRAIAAQLVRKLLVIAGPAIRVVEPSTGRVLSELDVGPHLTDFAIDSRFTLYTYTEPDLLQAFGPGTLLSIVG